MYECMNDLYLPFQRYEECEYVSVVSRLVCHPVSQILRVHFLLDLLLFLLFLCRHYSRVSTLQVPVSRLPHMLLSAHLSQLIANTFLLASHLLGVWVKFVSKLSECTGMVMTATENEPKEHAEEDESKSEDDNDNDNACQHADALFLTAAELVHQEHHRKTDGRCMQARALQAVMIVLLVRGVSQLEREGDDEHEDGGDDLSDWSLGADEDCHDDKDRLAQKDNHLPPDVLRFVPGKRRHEEKGEETCEQ